MTKRTIDLIGGIPQAITRMKHKTPSYPSPSFITDDASVQVGDINILATRAITRDDLLCVREFRFCWKTTDWTDQNNLCDSAESEVRIFRNDEDKPIFQTLDYITDEDWCEDNYISLNKSIPYLTPGLYTIYISGIKCDQESFEFIDNMSVFRFRVYTNEEALLNEKLSHFSLETYENAVPLLSEGLVLRFKSQHSDVKHYISCYGEYLNEYFYEEIHLENDNELLLVSTRCWLPGTYTCIIENELTPVAQVVFTFDFNGIVSLKEGIDPESPAYKMSRLRLRNISLFKKIQENVYTYGTKSYTRKAMEWLDHYNLDRISINYGGIPLYDTPDFEDDVLGPKEIGSTKLFDMITEIYSYHIKLSKEALTKIAHWVIEEYAAHPSWTNETFESFLHTTKANFRMRLIMLHELIGPNDLKEFLTTIEACDIDWNINKQEAEEETDYDMAMQKLNDMVGLTELKQRIDGIFRQVKFNALRKSFGLRHDQENGHHMLFFGNPGTGKTTVAKYIGRIFHSMGLLSDGDVIVTERTKMVGRYLGETEKRMEELLEKAKGKVLFIDEAYSLFAGNNEKVDYGRRVLESLLVKMSEKNPDMIVVMAGYEKELTSMLESNPGLKSRFAHKLHFPDYNVDELMQIGEKVLDREDYELNDEARELLYEVVKKAVEEKDEFFSNARWIDHFIIFDILPEIAKRVMSLHGNVDADTCRTILREDVENARKNIQPSKKGQRIGF